MVSVNPRPLVTAVPDKGVICSGESTGINASGANTYTWNTNSNAATITPTLVIDLPYSYTVTGTGANGCVNSAVATVSVNKCTGINEQQAQVPCTYFP